MTVEEMERRFYELKGRLDVGAITEEQFKSEIEKLRFQDAQNRWWMIGAQSGKWYTFDGTRWIPSQPPAETVPASQPPPEPRPAVLPAPVPPPLPMSEEKKVEETLPALGPVTPRPMPITPRPARLRRAPTPLKLPISGPIVIGCAAFAAIVLVIVFGFAVDNLVPGKLISSFLGGLTSGGKPSAAPTPTLPVGQPAVSSNDVTLLIAAGDQFALQSQFDTAIAQYTAAAQVAPSSPVPLTRWSRALALRGQIEDALAKAQLATQREPNDADASAQLARVLAWSGQTDAAMAAGEKAIQLNPKNADAHAFLAEAYLFARRAAEAQSQAQAALQLAPQSAEAHRAQAWVLTLAGQKEAALAEWKQTLSLEPNLFFRHYELAEVHRLYFNAPADAVTEYHKAIALYGAYIPAYSRLGLAFLDLNQPQDAIAQFQRAITLDPNNANGLAYLGLAFQKADQCPQAIPYFEQSLKIDASNSVAQKGLSDCQSGKPPSVPAPTAPSVPLVPPTLAPPRP